MSTNTCKIAYIFNVIHTIHNRYLNPYFPYTDMHRNRTISQHESSCIVSVGNCFVMQTSAYPYLALMCTQKTHRKHSLIKLEFHLWTKNSFIERGVGGGGWGWGVRRPYTHFAAAGKETLGRVKYKHDMGQVSKVRLSCYLLLLSNDSKTRWQDRPTFVTRPISNC